MTRPTRLFLFVSGGILAVGLGTGLVAAYVGGFQNLLGSTAPDELAYLPSDAKLVAFANVREIMNSELHQKLRDMAPRNDNGMARFESETGVDVTRDVDYVFAAMGADGDAAAHQGYPLVMARGRFDNVRIEGVVRARGGVVQDYNGVRLVTFSDPANAAGGVLAFLEPGLIAMGPESAVKRAIDGRSGSANVTGNAELLRLVKEADDGNAWVVARFDALSEAGHLPADMLQRLPAINWITVTGHVNGGLRAALRAEARDDAAAKNLRDIIQGMLALAKLQTGQGEFAAVVNSIELGGDGKNVSLGLSVPIEVVDRLASLRAHAGGPPPAPQPPEAPTAPEPPPAPEPPAAP